MTPGRRNRLLLTAIVLAAVLAADLGSKAWVWSELRESGRIVPVFGDRLYFRFAFNTGAAFGVLGDVPWIRPLFVGVTVVVAAVLVRLATTLDTDRASPFIWIGMMAGGALGNLHDRLLRVHDLRLMLREEVGFHDLIRHATAVADALGTGAPWIEVPSHGVVDFIVLRYGAQATWPAFNVADVALTVGTVGFVVAIWRTVGNEAPPDKQPA